MQGGHGRRSAEELVRDRWISDADHRHCVHCAAAAAWVVQSTCPVVDTELVQLAVPVGRLDCMQAARLCVEWWDRRTDTVPLHIDPALRTIIVVIIIPTLRSRSPLSIYK